jgi:hypothetical protein
MLGLGGLYPRSFDVCWREMYERTANRDRISLRDQPRRCYVNACSGALETGSKWPGFFFEKTIRYFLAPPQFLVPSDRLQKHILFFVGRNQTLGQSAAIVFGHAILPFKKVGDALRLDANLDPAQAGE